MRTIMILLLCIVTNILYCICQNKDRKKADALTMLITINKDELAQWDLELDSFKVDFDTNNTLWYKSVQEMRSIDWQISYSPLIFHIADSLDTIPFQAFRLKRKTAIGSVGGVYWVFKDKRNMKIARVFGEK